MHSVTPKEAAAHTFDRSKSSSHLIQAFLALPFSIALAWPTPSLDSGISPLETLYQSGHLIRLLDWKCIMDVTETCTHIQQGGQADPVSH
jgi:hypothetical protein